MGFSLDGRFSKKPLLTLNPAITMKNIISRKEALLYASRLRKLEPAYSLAHPEGTVGQIDEDGRIVFSLPDLKDEFERILKENEAKEDQSKKEDKEDKEDKNKKPEKEEKKEDKKAS